MGGSDVTSSVYSNGVITIPSVTGDIVIIATAKEIDVVDNMIDTAGVTSGKRLSSSSGSEKDQSGYFITGHMSVKKGDVIRTSGGNFNDANCFGGVWCYFSDGSYWTYNYTSASSSPISVTAWDIVVDANGNLVITIKNDSVASIRLCGIGTGTGLVVSKNKEIE
jgi:hypothetical protein